MRDEGADTKMQNSKAHSHASSPVIAGILIAALLALFLTGPATAMSSAQITNPAHRLAASASIHT
jgi:hypothetical protein